MKQVISESDESKSSEQEFDDIYVELSKMPGKGLGLSVVGRRDGCGVFISDMVSIITIADATRNFSKYIYIYKQANYRLNDITYFLNI